MYSRASTPPAAATFAARRAPQMNFASLVSAT
jgi:hypothetical protein